MKAIRTVTMFIDEPVGYPTLLDQEDILLIGLISTSIHWIIIQPSVSKVS